MINPELREIVRSWKLSNNGSLLERIDRMISTTLMGGYFGKSPTLIVCGSQYHLGGEKDTEELADLASVTPNDHVLDVCCFLGGPAIQLAQSFRCKVTGIDISERCIIAANEIARLCGVCDLVDSIMADAGHLPFKNGQFTVVWSQCSLDHNEVWLHEFDRLLAHSGRLALTFAIRRDNPNEDSPRWTLQDVVHLLQNLGYAVERAEDITERDIEIGWKSLDRKLSEREEEFTSVLGKDWVRDAHKKFEDEILAMRKGEWGNGRIIAIKKKP